MNIKNPVAASHVLSAYAPKTQAKAEAQPQARDAASMKVALSSGSKALYNEDQDVDMAKVQAIREALANGTLKVNPERIAEGLLESTFELLKR